MREPNDAPAGPGVGSSTPIVLRESAGDRVRCLRSLVEDKSAVTFFAVATAVSTLPLYAFFFGRSTFREALGRCGAVLIVFALIGLAALLDELKTTLINSDGVTVPSRAMTRTIGWEEITSVRTRPIDELRLLTVIKTKRIAPATLRLVFRTPDADALIQCLRDNRFGATAHLVGDATSDSRPGRRV